MRKDGQGAPTISDLKNLLNQDKELAKALKTSKALSEGENDFKAFRKFWQDEMAGAKFRIRFEQLGYNPEHRKTVSKLKDAVVLWRAERDAGK